MKNKTSWIAGALAFGVVLVVAGCAAMQAGGGGKAAACTSAVCNVTVTVSHCSVSVDVGELHVSRGNPKPQIIWHLKSSDPAVAFASDGIFFKSATNGQFPDLHREGANTFRATDLNTVPGVYEYGVSVTSGGSACPKLDPIIMNE